MEGGHDLKETFVRPICVAMLMSTSMLVSSAAEACTRFVYMGGNNQVITARSMDWKLDIGTNLWVFRSGEAGPNSIQWTSKYGSVIASGYDISTTDGMNDAGLVANVLWHGKTPGLSLAAWAQYVLDNFATVQEAVDTLAKEPFTGRCHLNLSSDTREAFCLAD